MSNFMLMRFAFCRGVGATQYQIYLDVRPRTPSTQLKPRWLPVTEALVPADLAEKLVTVSRLRVRSQGENVTCKR